MVINALKVGLRHLLKRKLFSCINIVGLAIGMAAVFLIVQHVTFEMSYDRRHDNAERIYRVCHNRFADGVIQYKSAQSFIPTGEALKNDFSIVEDYTTLFKISDQSEIIISHQTKGSGTIKFSEDRVYHTKGNFFKLFQASPIEGTLPAGELLPKTAWISSSTARKYFGDSQALGKIIHHPYSGDFTVAGVYTDFPANSHFIPDFLFSWESLTDKASGGDAGNWHWDGFYNYVLIRQGTTPGILEDNLSKVTAKYLRKDTLSAGASELWLQPLTDIHLHSNLVGEAGENGDGLMILILKGLAVFILLIAYLNYINLSTARAFERVKEIGIRKIIGSTRKQLAIQFILESGWVSAAALATAVLLVAVMSRLFPEEIIRFTPTLIGEPWFWFAVALTAVVGCVASAIYPAFVVSSFKPVSALKGKVTWHQSRFPMTLRTGMVTFQFALTIFMIAGSLIVHKQIRFMKQRDLGINISQTLVLKTFVQFGPPGSDSVFMRRLDLLKTSLLSSPGISGVTSSYDIPGKEHLSLFPTFRNIHNSENMVSLYYSRIDSDFIPSFDVNILAGRNFSSATRSDESAIVINKEALEALGFETADQAVGQEVSFGRGPDPRKVTVIGVVDFRAKSFKDKNLPVVYQTHWAPLRYLSVKLNDVSSLNKEIQFIQEQWVSHFPDQPFTYFFLDEYFNRQYQAEQKFSLISSLFTTLSVIIACLGLYGLASIVTVQRTKEVGIRKVLGASIRNLFLLLSKDFGFMLLFAAGIATPAVWYAISEWLAHYPYRTPMSWWVFVLPVFAMAIMSIMTIGQHAWRVAITNPIDSLRDD